MQALKGDLTDGGDGQERKRESTLDDGAGEVFRAPLRYGNISTHHEAVSDDSIAFD